MVLEEIDLVDVQKAAVGPREESGLEGLLTIVKRALQVQGTDHPILGGTER